MSLWFPSVNIACNTNDIGPIACSIVSLGKSVDGCFVSHAKTIGTGRAQQRLDNNGTVPSISKAPSLPRRREGGELPALQSLTASTSKGPKKSDDLQIKAVEDRK